MTQSSCHLNRSFGATTQFQQAGDVSTFTRDRTWTNRFDPTEVTSKTDLSTKQSYSHCFLEVLVILDEPAGVYTNFEGHKSTTNRSVLGQ